MNQAASFQYRDVAFEERSADRNRISLWLTYEGVAGNTGARADVGGGGGGAPLFPPPNDLAGGAGAELADAPFPGKRGAGAGAGAGATD
eukprot:jgi/Hompol1/4435/HPOL_001777-RA